MTGAAKSAPPSCRPAALTAPGSGDSRNAGIKRSDGSGRLRFKPAGLNAVWLTGDFVWSKCGWSACAPASDVAEAGSGTDTARSNCNAQPPKTAANRHSAATIAIADRERGGLSLLVTVAQLYQRKSDGQRPTANYTVNSSHHGPRAGQLDSAGHLSESSATRSAPQAHRQPVAYPAAGGRATTVGRKPYFGAALRPWPVPPTSGIAGTPAASPGGPARGVLPNAAGSPLAGGATAVQPGGCHQLRTVSGDHRRGHGQCESGFVRPGSRFGTTSGLAGLGRGDTHPGRIRRRGSGHRRRRGPLPWPADQVDDQRLVIGSSRS